MGLAVVQVCGLGVGCANTLYPCPCPCHFSPGTAPRAEPPQEVGDGEGGVDADNSWFELHVVSMTVVFPGEDGAMGSLGR